MIARCWCRRHAALQQLESWVTKRYAYAEEARRFLSAINMQRMYSCTEPTHSNGIADSCFFLSRHRRLGQSPSSRSCWVGWVSSVRSMPRRHWMLQAWSQIWGCVVWLAE